MPLLPAESRLATRRRSQKREQEAPPGPKKAIIPTTMPRTGMPSRTGMARRPRRWGRAMVKVDAARGI